LKVVINDILQRTVKEEGAYMQIVNDIFENFLPTLKSKSVDCVVMDPPYGYLKHKLDCPFDYPLLFTLLDRVLKDDSFLLFFGRGELFYKWCVYVIDMGYEFVEEVIWDKNQMSSPILPLARVHETIALFRKGKKKINRVYIDKFEYDQNSDNAHRVYQDLNRIVSELRRLPVDKFDDWRNFKLRAKSEKPTKHKITCNIKLTAMNRSAETLQSYERGRLLTSIIRVKKEHFNFKHPTQKPLQLIDQLIQLISNEGDVILDPFLGSGTTIVSCIKNKRIGIGCEKDPEYFKIIQENIKIATEQLSLF
jgi:site-specific DNA-methyltransferase (adenine-specific)